MTHYLKHSFETTSNSLVKELDEQLPDEYCIIKVERLKEVDKLNDLLDRVTLAESAYHKLLEELNELKEKYNIND